MSPPPWAEASRARYRGWRVGADDPTLDQIRDARGSSASTRALEMLAESCSNWSNGSRLTRRPAEGSARARSTALRVVLLGPQHTPLHPQLQKEGLWGR